MTVQLAVLGCAHIHMADVVEAVRARPEVTVTAVWDEQSRRAAYWGERLGAPAVATPEEAVAAAEAVVVMSETVRHEALVRPAAEAGLDVFVEKPLGRSGAEAAIIADAVAHAGVRFHTGYLLREVDGHCRVRELLTEGALGDALRVRAFFAHPGALAGWFAEYPWTTDPDAAGFGGFGDEGIHALDLLCWLLDRPAVAGTANIDRVTPEARIDERGEALVRFEGGVVGSFGGGWTEPRLTSELFVAGTHGRARVVDGELMVETGNGERHPSSMPAAQQPIERFLSVVAGQSDEPLVAVRDAAEHCRVLESLYDAAAEARWVNL